MKAAELAYESDVKLSGMRLQMLKTESGIESLLGIFFSEFTVDENFCTTIYLKSGDSKYVYKAHCMEGRQRCVLPQEATEQICSHLQSGQEVALYTKRSILRLEPKDFEKYYKKLLKR